MNVYCVVKCAGEKVKSNIVESTLEPAWKQFSAVFYRTKKLPSVDIEVTSSPSVFAALCYLNFQSLALIKIWLSAIVCSF